MIIDTHTHFYDPTRPGGVPWPPANDAVLYRTVLPAHWRTLAEPVGVDATIIVEASEWVEDNQWILDLAATEPTIVGFVGRLRPQEDGFAAHVSRFAANPIFRGVRLRIAEVSGHTDAVVAGIRKLADCGLTLDLLLRPDSLPHAARLAAAFPGLRIMLDHVAEVRIDGQAPDPVWVAGVQALTRYPEVYCKVSGLVEATGQRPAPLDPAFYVPTLNVLWDSFGEDRLVFGSNWPVCEHFASYAQVKEIAESYFAAKGSAVLDKVFCANSQRAYRWESRTTGG